MGNKISNLGTKLFKFGTNSSKLGTKLSEFGLNLYVFSDIDVKIRRKQFLLFQFYSLAPIWNKINICIKSVKKEFCKTTKLGTKYQKMFRGEGGATYLICECCTFFLEFCFKFMKKFCI